MFELTINGQVFNFRFGIGFMREMNKKLKRTENGVTKEVGLQMAVAGLIDGDIEDLIDILDVANKTEEPRLSRKQIEDYIEDDETDIDELFNSVLDFLSKANATKKQTVQLLEMWEQEKAKNQN